MPDRWVPRLLLNLQLHSLSLTCASDPTVATVITAIVVMIAPMTTTAIIDIGEMRTDAAAI